MTDDAMNPGGNAGANSSSVHNMNEIGEEMKLKRDWAMSMGGNEGAAEGPVNNMNETGLIFDFEDIKKSMLERIWKLREVQ